MAGTDKRPRIPEELHTRVLEVSDRIESVAPDEARDFKTALEIVVEHADEGVTVVGEIDGLPGAFDDSMAVGDPVHQRGRQEPVDSTRRDRSGFMEHR